MPRTTCHGGSTAGLTGAQLISYWSETLYVDIGHPDMARVPQQQLSGCEI